MGRSPCIPSSFHHSHSTVLVERETQTDVLSWPRGNRCVVVRGQQVRCRGVETPLQRHHPLPGASHESCLIAFAEMALQQGCPRGHSLRWYVYLPVAMCSCATLMKQNSTSSLLSPPRTMCTVVCAAPVTLVLPVVILHDIFGGS